MIGQDEHCILITEYLLLALNSLSRKMLALARPNIRHRQTARPGDPPIGNIGGIGSCFWQMRRLAPSVPQNLAVVCFTSVLLSLIAISLSPFLLYINPRRAEYLF